MKIASFNVNSVRVRLDIVLEWLKIHQPDILCLQETKAQDKDFPAQAFEAMKYHCTFKGQKSYNGVAVISKTMPDKVTCGFADEPRDQSRFITAQFKDTVIINTYIPQGFDPQSEKFQYKLDWFKRLRGYLDRNLKPTDKIIWVGDLNVAPLPIDVHDPESHMGHVCFCPEVWQQLENVIEFGFIDIFRKHCDQPGQYTFWDYRMKGSLSRNRGWRLDHILATKPAAQKSTTCFIDIEPRKFFRSSDHTPIVAEFDL